MSLEERVANLEVFETAGGARIYQLPLELFPWMWGYAYLICIPQQGGGEEWVLIDSGSGLKDSNRSLDLGFQKAGELAGLTITYANLSYILITHGHIDHVGGLPHILSQTTAPVGVHELDRRILTNYEERLTVVSRRLKEFLIEAGLDREQLERMMSMYMLTKTLFRSVEVGFTYEAEGMRRGRFEFLHVPGHCAGHVAIRLDDVIFCGDHILNHTSPHQAPERITLSTGLEHYLKSLQALLEWGSRPRLLLGGHEEPVQNLAGRISEIRAVHQERLQKVLELLVEPRTIRQVAESLFGEPPGYHELLAVEEAGAHVEYLYQRGLLEIANLGELEQVEGPAPIYYRTAGPRQARRPRDEQDSSENR
jgi:glyoxylase-like metal-dependent hydrolase (beta-lactamase superfamily II)